MHNHCQHSFGYCGTCDAVYCRNCRREWSSHRPTFYGPYFGDISGVMPLTYGTTSTGGEYQVHGHN